MLNQKIDQNADLDYYAPNTVTRHILKAAASGLAEPMSFEAFLDHVIKTAANEDVDLDNMAAEYVSDLEDVKDPVMETVLITLDLMEQHGIVDVELRCFDTAPPTAEIVSIKLSNDGKLLTDVLFS